jgi:hypothetical protein
MIVWHIGYIEALCLRGCLHSEWHRGHLPKYGTVYNYGVFGTGHNYIIFGTAETYRLLGTDGTCRISDPRKNYRPFSIRGNLHNIWLMVNIQTL